MLAKTCPEFVECEPMTTAANAIHRRLVTRLTPLWTLATRFAAQLSGRWASNWVAPLLLALLTLCSPAVQAGVDTGLSDTTNVAGPFPIGFTFKYFGEDQTEFGVSASGMLKFGGLPPDVNDNTCFPFSFAVGGWKAIFPFWDDLTTAGTSVGNVRYQTLGTSPHRQLVVQWTDMIFRDTNEPMGSFQVILFEGTNEVRLQYRNLVGNRAQGSSATIGLSGLQSGAGWKIGCNDGTPLQAGQFLSFLPKGGGVYISRQQSQGGFVDISGSIPDAPSVSASYTQQAPQWFWPTSPSYNAYEIEIQNANGDVVSSQVLGNAGDFVYAAGQVDGASFKARIRASADNGATWQPWSGTSVLTTVDLGVSFAEILRVKQLGGYLEADYSVFDTGSGVMGLGLQASTDPSMVNPFADHVLQTPSGMDPFNWPRGATQVYLQLKATDVAGNVKTHAWTQNLLQKPVITRPAPDEMVLSSPLLLEGTATPGSRIEITGSNVGPVDFPVASPEGRFSVLVPIHGAPGYVSQNIWVSSSLGDSASESSETIYYNSNFSSSNVTATFGGQVMEPWVTITQNGNLVITANNPSGVARIEAAIDSNTVIQHEGNNSSPFTISQPAPPLTDGTHFFQVVVTGTDGGETAISFPFLTDIKPPPPAPVITSPVDGTTVTQAQVVVTGTAASGAQTRVRIDGYGGSTEATSSADGNFTATVTLPVEGTSKLVALSFVDGVGYSAESTPVNITYAPPPPSVAFVSPADNATLTAASVTVEVNASDANGLTQVQLLVDDQPLVTLTSPPWRTTWNLASVTGGSHTLRAVATNTAGKTAQATRVVSVQKALVPAPIITLPTEGYIGLMPLWGVTGTATAGAQVQVYVDDQPVGSSVTVDASGQFSTSVTVTEGAHTLSAKAIQNQEQSAFSTPIHFTYTPPPPNVTFVSPADNAVVTDNSVTVEVSATDVNGMAQVQLLADDQTLATLTRAPWRTTWDLSAVAAGTHTLRAVASNTAGKTAQTTRAIVVQKSPPGVPAITTPANGTTVRQAQLNVSGTATPGAQVQVHVDGTPAGNPATASASGTFATTVTLAEGPHSLTARASNAYGSSALSTPVNITYTAPAPTVVFVSPAANATLSDVNVTVEVSATDANGLTQVQLLADDQPLATLTSPPWRTTWDLSTVADGAHTLRAVATNTAGKTAQATQNVTRKKYLPPPPLPYTVANVTVSPATSFGSTPIQIGGQVLTNPGGQPMANAALRMVLNVQGFERRLNIFGDANGQFAYTFVPQANDAGTYSVRVIHPEDSQYASQPAQGSFTINRLSANYGQYTLNAIRGFASAAVVNVSASAGSGAHAVHWRMNPADQPSGALPAGISLDMGNPVDVDANTSVPTSIKLTGSASAGASGTIILKLYAQESGNTPRAELRLDYQLHEARPGLTPEPAALEIGVQQTKTASAKLTISNKGYSAAQNVRVQLLTREGNPPPSWVSLASTPDIGALDLGQSTAIQVNASPGTDVADGYHQLQLRISADNDPGGTVPVTIAVARDGQGGVRFKLVDIYTNTLGANGQPIVGLANARIVLQNEALTADIRSAQSNETGVAEFAAIPPGNYRWRASAAQHSDASGRISVLPGLTATERVFLDYQTVSIEFGVTETTIKDEYHIVVEATYQTQVPAPVVLMEPMSISLPAMQQGEEITGELTLSNYGLVRADNVQYALPSSDDTYKYEFFGTLPTQLAAKSRVSIPYRVTALKALAQGQHLNLEPAQTLQRLGLAANQPAPRVQQAIRQFLQSGNAQGMDPASSPQTVQAAAQAASCSSYKTELCLAYSFTCVAGDLVVGSACVDISRIVGSSCGGSGTTKPGGSSGPSTDSSGPRWGKGWIDSLPSIPLVPSCVPSCSACRGGGGSGPGGSGGPGPGGSGGPGPGGSGGSGPGGLGGPLPGGLGGSGPGGFGGPGPGGSGGPGPGDGPPKDKNKDNDDNPCN
jgi:hypothetical protein